ncbi:hypothetical protein [Desulforhabdus amnigena]|jgi:hypothetical protein|uniref:Uncharacterized protein n=1 Tax=Desulforhabdus amnigena TaxID=40218 RepID=A0A9W6CZX3_9BACT|nr:hypothetical protein [Desulforhabdus amnigena]NLJ28409.1 hypothetical protein [Deltaproteobacteria bacterium]GLI33427.1 hypothetical protein DAMNIGENAA_08600 [Desulforhabdus amnigena]
MEHKAALDRLISRQRISMEIEKINFNPMIRDEKFEENAAHYQCRLSKPGRAIHVYFSLQDCEDRVTLSDVLFMLAMDASGCKMLEGYDEIREEWTSLFGGSDGNLREIEDFWHEFTGRCNQTKQLENFLGEADFEELVGHFESLSPLDLHL